MMRRDGRKSVWVFEREIKREGQWARVVLCF